MCDLLYGSVKLVSNRPNLFLEVHPKTANVFSDLRPLMVATKGAESEGRSASLGTAYSNRIRVCMY